VLSSVVVLAALSAATALVLTSGGEPGQGPTEAERSNAPAAAHDAYHPCQPGTRLLWNHQSKLYLDADEGFVMASEPLPVRVSLVPGVPGTSSDCLVKVHPASADEPALCMDLRGDEPAAGATSAVSWRECDGGPAQQWNIQFHWRSEYSDGSGFLVYYHIVTDSDTNSCLQQAHDGGPGAPLIVVTCNDGWLQQWVVAPEA
jgi:hypothetical protein